MNIYVYATTTAWDWGFGPVPGKRCVTRGTVTRERKRSREQRKSGKK